MRSDEDRGAGASQEKVPAYSWYVLGVLTLTYVFNFVDRQILSILANDIKADLGLTDADLGFLYGTAFAVFYAVFGIPLGRLADSWHRVRLISIGLVLWSTMTSLSGLAKNAGTITGARIGVAVGEAAASPSAYSLISDYFPPRLRATALATYSTGLYIGGALSLLIGALITESWNAAYPEGGPFGLVGWQATFLAVGLPGLGLALWLLTLREPVRGGREGTVATPTRQPFRDFMREVIAVIPPFSLIGAAQRGRSAFAVNIFVALLALTSAYIVAVITDSDEGRVVSAISDQWLFVSIGYYSVFCSAASLRTRDNPTFQSIWNSKAFLAVVVAYACCAFIGYAVSYWTVPYAERSFGVTKSELGLFIGAPAAAAGFLGAIGGGRLADILQTKYRAGQVVTIALGIAGPVPAMLVAFTTDSIVIFYVSAFFMYMMVATAVGPAAAVIQNLVQPRMRATATATYFLGHTLIGLAIGPFMAGFVSSRTGDLAIGILSTLVVVPIGLLAVVIAMRCVPRACIANAA